MAKEVNVKLNLQGANEAEKALNKFGLSVNDLKENEVEPLSFAIGELEDQLYAMASAGKMGTKEFKMVAEEVSRMKTAIVEVDMVVDAMTGSTFGTMSSALGGVASGFAVAQGAIGAFGVESEAIEEQLLKVQSAMAISDGLMGLKESVASFKALKNSIMATSVAQKGLAVVSKVVNAVMKANPIGLIITAIAALIAGIVALIKNWEAVVDALKFWDVAAKKRAADQEKLDREQLARTEALRKAFEKSSDEKISQLDHEIAKRKANGEDTYKIELKKHKLIVAFTRERIKMLNEEFQLKRKLGEVDEEYAKQVAEQAKSLKETLKSSRNAIEIMEIEHQKSLRDKEETHQKELADKRKAAYEKRKAEREKELEEERKKAEELAKAREEALKAEEEARLKQIELEDVQYKMLQQLRSTAQENEIAALVEAYEEKFLLAQGNAELEKALQEQLKTDIAAINDKFRKEQEEKEEEARQKQKEADDKALQDKLARQQASVDMASSALDAINGLVQAFAGDNEAAQKKAFAIDKAVNIAKAVMNTATGVSQALASSPPPLSFVNAGIAASVGAAQIATIAKTKFGGGSASASASIPSAPSVTARPAEFNIIGNSGTNQLAETLSGQPMKAYVVGSEVTTQQALDRNRVNNASI